MPYPSIPEDRITPIEDQFVYHIFGIPGEARAWSDDPADYRLKVGGMVETPLELSLGDLREQFEAVRFPIVLQCMTNVHWGRVEFTGARLWDVLQHAGLSDSATKLALRAADGYDTDLKLDYVRSSGEPVLLAYEMNAEPIPLDHGCPVRIASPDRYGYKWPKWITEIEAVDTDYKGHYEYKRGWSDDGERGKPVT